MDTGNFFIASYEERTDKVSFPYAFVDGQKLNTEDPNSPWRPRSGGKGLTEKVIQEKKYTLMNTKAEQEKWYAERAGNYVNINFASWLGVPLLYGDRVIGIIATYHKTDEYKYGEEDAQILSIIADALTSAWKNTREVTALQMLSGDLLRLTASFWEQEPTTSDGRNA
jgi:transcriptional regulator with GAF, ATPase, and Fis domain